MSSPISYRKYNDGVVLQCEVKGCKSYHDATGFFGSGGCPLDEVLAFRRTLKNSGIYINAKTVNGSAYAYGVAPQDKVIIHYTPGTNSLTEQFVQSVLSHKGTWERDSIGHSVVNNKFIATHNAQLAREDLRKRQEEAHRINRLQCPLEGMSLVEYVRGVEVPTI